MRILVALPYFNYETFAENTEFKKIWTFDASTPEKETAAKRTLLLDEGFSNFFLVEDQLVEVIAYRGMTKPKEPQFKASEIAKNPEKVQKAAVKFEVELAAFNEAKKRAEQLEAEIESKGLKTVVEGLDNEDVNKLFEDVLKRESTDGCQNIYFTELLNV